MASRRRRPMQIEIKAGDAVRVTGQATIMEA
jgi:hypothetical protein